MRQFSRSCSFFISNSFIQFYHWKFVITHQTFLTFFMFELGFMVLFLPTLANTRDKPGVPAPISSPVYNDAISTPLFLLGFVSCLYTNTHGDTASPLLWYLRFSCLQAMSCRRGKLSFRFLAIGLCL